MSSGVIVIGRNEGDRLIASLQSLASSGLPVVYVDSGSSDESVQNATNLGADVISLDLSIPFTAARARNAGLKRLNEKWPELQYVQFIDGDCVVIEGWITAAEAFLDKHKQAAVVCGRRRELYPNATIYNDLCDTEWDTPVGEAIGCGGDAMMRIAAFQGVGGFRSDLIAGEEPELCLRLRETGWTIWRLPVEMTHHDANIRNFAQWWKRTFRGGFAYAAVLALHASSPKRIWLREFLRAILLGLLLPVCIIAVSVLNTAALGLFLLYPLQVARLALRLGPANATSWRYGLYMVIAKFAEAQGILKFMWSRILRRENALIEYK